MTFIASHLPPVPARVLDAGCGTGSLAACLLSDGYDVTAIDIDPSLASPLVRVADICSYEDSPFDAVIFSLSLHHVHSLELAVSRARELLSPGGVLLVDEFAHERADGAIADRFYGEPGSLGRWREQHGEYHTGASMLEAISGRFTVASFVRVPYLYRYLEDESVRDFESELGFHLVAHH
ncbi:class I SAM-dependent methyltransferase [Nonomuraea sp. NPDC050536]|uniref:class I SAM-dependent methyltransferase n=1 Tax=Nonomuraea sp. NPDC050536 TaxID=3364366 RepID=UPI0037CB0E71